MRIFHGQIAGDIDLTLDLAAVRCILARPDGQSWYIDTGAAGGDITVDPAAGAAIRDAWRAYHGQSEARSRPLPDLPAGWTWRLDDEATAASQEGGTKVRAAGAATVTVWTDGYVRVDVVAAVIAAHRARVGGAP